MLRLTRKPGESIQIGDNIKITVLDDSHNQALNRSPVSLTCSYRMG